MERIYLLSGGAGQGLVHALQPAFSAEAGIDIDGTFGAVGAMQDRLLDGAPCDVLLLTDALMRGLAAQGRVVAETLTPVGRIRTGVAVLEEAPRPAVATPDELRKALLAASAIHFPDPQRATAGIHFVKVLRALGIEADVGSRLRPHPNGATAMRAMAEAGDPGAIGCTQITEILIAAGVQCVAALPPEFELATVYTAGIAANARHPEAARRFVELLTGSASADVRRAVGIE